MQASAWRLIVQPLPFVLALTTCSALAADVATRATTVFVVRHAEKSTGDGDVPLSAAGRERAALLAWTLKDANVTRIFTSQARRTQETAAPLAGRLQIGSEVVPALDTGGLVAALRALPRGSTALVVGHSNTVPLVVEGLGGPKLAPFADDEFDRLLVVTVGEGTATVANLRYGPQPKDQH